MSGTNFEENQNLKDAYAQENMFDTEDTMNTQKSEQEVESNFANEQNEENTETVEEVNPLICPTCGLSKDAEDARLRALAEMENFKKRLKKEKDEQMAYAAESVLADLLPSLDNLDLALQYGSTEEACQNTMMGVEMTRKLLLDAVKRHGLETIGASGEEFNPELHEALSYETSDTIPNGHIVSVMQKGYVLKGRLLRPAKVSISQNNETGNNLNATA